MSDDIRWQQRLNSFRLSLASLDEVYERRQERELDRVELQALIKSFELSYETGWNLLKDWLEYQGFVDISGSRDAIRRAHSLELISDGDTWMQMLRTRNRTAHVYNEAVAREVEEYIVSRFYRTLHELAAEDIPGLDAENSAALRGVFRDLGIREVRLYGSRAKGTHRQGSDIDLCIMSTRLSLAKMAQLEEAIDELLLPYEIDLCNYHDIENPELRAHIDRCGVPILRE